MTSVIGSAPDNTHMRLATTASSSKATTASIVASIVLIMLEYDRLQQ